MNFETSKYPKNSQLEKKLILPMQQMRSVKMLILIEVLENKAGCQVSFHIAFFYTIWFGTYLGITEI